MRILRRGYGAGRSHFTELRFKVGHVIMSDDYSIQLDGGRDLFLVALNQSRTYEGLLEGLPTKEKNAGIIKRAAKTAQELWRGAPYLITPTETAITLDHDYPFGTPASIPVVVCFARFRSF